jgi:hypothetical protein
MKLFFTLFFLSVFSISFSQQIMEWQHSYGGTSDDMNPCVIKTTDNGLLIAGSSQSNDVDVSINNGFYDIWVVKTDVSGNPGWQKSFGGSQNDFICKEMQSSDGNYFLLGSSQSSDGDLTLNKGGSDLWLLKINTSGDIIWQKTYGGSSNDKGNNLIEMSNGKLMIIGETESADGDITSNHGLNDIWLLCLNPDGSLNWQKTYGGSNDDYGQAMDETDSSMFILAGHTYSDDGDIITHYGQTDKCDYFAMKIDSTGNLKWAKNFGGNENDNLSGMCTTYDGFLLYGNSNSDNGNITGCHGLIDGWMIKINPCGGVQWQKSVGGSGDDYISGIIQREDSYLCLAGTTYSSDGDIALNKGESDCWLLLLDPSGPLQWSTTFGGSMSDITSSVAMIDDANTVIGASTYSSDGDITNNIGLYDYWIIKATNPASVNDIAISENNFIISPNPSSGFINIISLNNICTNTSLNLLDISGRSILQKEYDNFNSATMDLSSIPAGIYILKIFCDHQDYYLKIIKN